MCTRHATARAQTRLPKRQAQVATANVGGFKSLCLQRRGEPRLKLCPGFQFPNQIFTSVFSSPIRFSLRFSVPQSDFHCGFQFPNQIFTTVFSSPIRFSLPREARSTRRSPRRRRAAPRAQLSAPRRSAVSHPRVSRKTAAFGRQSCGTEGTRVLDPGPRSHCRAGLSFAADARAYSELGSHAKTGLRARRAPRTGRRAPTANEVALSDRAAIARRIGAPAEKRARAAAARRRGWLQSALREPEHRPRSRGHRA